MKATRILRIAVLAICVLAFTASCSPEGFGNTVEYTDSCGRAVQIPSAITRVAPSGQVAQMLIFAVNPDVMVGLGAKLPDAAKEFIDEKYQALPVFGQLYGKNASLNLEELLAAQPQIIIDMGDKKDNMEEDLDALQEQTGIPVIFIEANMETYGVAAEKLGELLGAKEQGAAIKLYMAETLQLASECRAAIADENRLSVYFGTGVTGLDANAAGNMHAAVIDIVGASNAAVVDDVSSKGGGNIISIEQLYGFDPDVIILSPDGPFDTLAQDPAWAQLRAVQNGCVFKIPAAPYNFMADPPSVNRAIGIRWLGSILYKDVYNQDMVAETQNFCKLFWHFDLTEAQAKQILGAA